MPLEIEIDGKKLEVPDGSTVMDAARIADIYVPHFCYHRKLSIAANCRMCLVQIEKAPKPMPACATPVTNGMKVMTHSQQAVTAQKGVMEFLLINHPLDCPICDQGGECQLQDLAVGYGGSGSQYEEDKRVVGNKNLGPLISTDMTRCIHCTRCVRFGQEIAGVMELGMIGRGEHSEIITFVGKTVDSELSGNAIDLCPVGALTSKPFRYSARTWELTRKASVSPHCGLGSNLTLQIKQNRVMRSLPRENEAINECWISDKDRFSYEGLNSAQRLTRPMVKADGQWKEVDWQTALDAVVTGLKKAGGANVGALATPHQTVEELHLLQKLMRGLGSNNIDHRLRQSDFCADGKMAGAPWLGMAIAEIAQLDRVLVIGSTLRKDHPLIAHRLRQAAKKALRVNLLHSVDDDLLMRVANRSIVAPAELATELAGIVKAAAAVKNVAAPAVVAKVTVSDAAERIAASLCDGKNAAVFLGNFTQHHAQAAQLHALAQSLADITGAKLGVLGEAANSVGAYVVNALPGPGGKHARDMLAQPMRAYVLLGVEPELDTQDPCAALAAMQQAEFVVAMSAFQHKAVDYAHVLLPIAPFTETAGTFVNTEGCVQSFQGVVQPLGDTRPAWKVLRVLGNLLDVPGFDQQSADEVRVEALGANNEKINKNNRLQMDVAVAAATVAASVAAIGAGMQRIAETPIYAADALVRRAPSLQKTRDGAAPLVTMNRVLAEKLGLREGDSVRVEQGGGVAEVGYAIDDKLPADCVRLAAAREETSGLGAANAPLALERVAIQHKVAV